MPKPTLRNLLASLLVAAASSAFIGCKSLDKPDSASFASVRIQGHTPEQIRAATVVVFQQNGYTPVEVQRAELVFEKEGSQWDRIAYGSWLDNTPVWVRARVVVVSLSDGEYVLQCQAYKVRNKGDPGLEDQVRLKHSRRKPYQALLDKVLGQLQR